MSLFVLKFGGSTLGKESEALTNLAKISEIIQSYINDGHQLVVVVSAFAGETRNLRDTYQNLGIQPDTAYSDHILAMGEQKSSIVVANYLNNVANLKAIAMLGGELPIVTDEHYGDAKIIDIKTDAIKHYLQAGFITVIPGFIGQSANGHTTTIGLDGSDTTAAYVAGYLGCKECRLYKDVTGVFTANPRRVPLAQKISTVDIKSMSVFSELGARIIHPRALEATAKYNLDMRILPDFVNNEGTIISQKAQSPKITGITYWQHDKDKITVSIIGEMAAESALKELAKNDISAKKFPTAFDNLSTTLLLDNPAHLNKSLQILHNFAGLDDTEAALRTAQTGFFDPALPHN